MSYIAEDFREMTPNREHNYCCGGGGGFNGMGIFRPQRNVALKMKRKQILGQRLQVGGGAVSQLLGRHTRHGRGLPRRHPVVFLKALLIDMCIVPEHLKLPEEE